KIIYKKLVFPAFLMSISNFTLLVFLLFFMYQFWSIFGERYTRGLTPLFSACANILNQGGYRKNLLS
ncbi:TPA: hypothetical protein ACHU7F_002048, partial [Streptococcus suis]